MINQSWNFHSTERIVFGNGSIQQLNNVLQRLNATKLLIVTDQGIRKAGILDRVVPLLEKENYQTVIYDEVVSDPPAQMAIDCAEYAKSQFEPDCIIGLGGGSCIDIAKLSALLLTHGGHPLDYAKKAVPGPTTSVVAIPTTAGTASEVTTVAVVQDVENKIKLGVSDEYLRPDVALLDPELTIGLPPYTTACSGIDALSHAIESYMTKSFAHLDSEGVFQGSSPLSDSLAYKAIELIANNLTTAVHQGSNLEARGNMLLASLIAGMAFSNSGTGAVHALAYPINGIVKSPHGEVTGLLLPYVMQYNSTVQKSKMIDIAKAFGIDTSLMPKQEAVLAASTAVLNLVEEIGLPTRLSQIGIKEKDVPVIAEKAIGIDRLIRTNPRTPRVSDFEKLLNNAL
ncbi:iron-containing alcohol dehydrogenase family protein [Halalkalibacter oceani]|uniref:iron-containing alcohol dehydrogenase family protein n=1 Tax=Halalkalibacter oceani TaxID=1653776 RepID=UPI003395ED30